MRRKADALVETIWATDVSLTTQANILASQVGVGAKVQFQQFYEQHVRPYLTQGAHGSRLLDNPLQTEEAFARLRALPGLADVVEEIRTIEGFCAERRQLADQERLHHWLHAWLLVHVPLSVLLLVLGVAHVVVALYY